MALSLSRPVAVPFIQRAGRLWGQGVLCHGRRCLDRRCTAFPLLITGAEHLRAALAGPCLIVANHVIIRAENAPLGRMTQARLLQMLNQPPDSFVLRRVVWEESGLPLYVVAKSDRGWWSPRPLVKLLQKRVGQPFGKGMMEGMDFVPVEHNPDCFHRTFFQSAARPLERGCPLLIFPGKLRYDSGECRDSLTDPDATSACVLPGAAHLARKFSLPILPVFLEGCDSWRPDQPTRVSFGPAFSAAGMSKTDINRAILQRVQDLSLSPALSFVREERPTLLENCHPA